MALKNNPVFTGVRTIARILTCCRQHFYLFILSVLFMLIETGFAVGSVVYIGHLIDLIRNKQLELVILYLKAGGPVLIVLMLLMWSGLAIRKYYQACISKEMGVLVYNKIMHLPFSEIQVQEPGDLVFRINSDAENLGSSLIENFFTIINNVILCITAFFYLAKLNLFPALLVLIAGPVIFFSGRFLDAKIKNATKNIARHFSALTGMLIEFIAGMEIIRNFNLAESFLNNFNGKMDKAGGLIKKRSLYSAVTGKIIPLFNKAVVYFITYLICYLAANNTLTLGSVISFIFLIGRVQEPFINISRTWAGIQQGTGTAERLLEILDRDSPGSTCRLKLTEEKQGAAAGAQSRPPGRKDSQANACMTAINLAGVHYSHNARTPLFTDLTLRIRHREKIGIVGVSGAGKTTLIRLFLNLLTPHLGNIEIYGMPAAAEAGLTRACIAYVPQTNFIFSGTVLENITLGSAEAEMPDVIRAAGQAQAHEFISGLKDGYNTWLSENGVNLSGGQRQRICIARALFTGARILILDEATSALDDQAEGYFAASLKEHFYDKTVVIVSHRFKLIQEADRILVFRDGQIAEEGTHAALLAQKGHYYFLYHAEKQPGKYCPV